MYPIILFCLAIAGALVHLLLLKKQFSFKCVIEVLLSYMIPINVGVATLIGFTLHTFWGSKIAAVLGLPPSTLFQYELASANFAIAVAGLLSIWQRKGFWLATVIVSAFYFLGAALGRCLPVFYGKPLYAAFPILIVGDIVIPLIYLVLIGIYAYQNRFFKE